MSETGLLGRSAIASLAMIAALASAIALTERAPPALDEPGPAPHRAALPEIAASAERGKSIYRRGIGAAEITATMGSGATVPAAALPCVNCHGRDGRGRPEGSVTPSSLRWASLTRPYEVTEPSGRRHPPYTPHLVGRAVTMGFDAAGAPLADVMPRYHLSRADLADLLAYLRTLGDEDEPGVTAQEIRIGMVVAADGPSAPRERAARALVSAYLARVNRGGGVYGRTLALRAIEAPSAPDARLAAVRGLVETERPFALTALPLGGSGDAVAAWLDAQQVPVVGALSSAPRGAEGLRRTLFQLHAGPAEQGEALAHFAVAELPAKARAAVVFAEGSTQRETARRIVAIFGKRGVASPTEHALAPGAGAALWAQLAREKVEMILFLGPPGEERALFREVETSAFRPTILAPAALAGDAWRGAPAALEGHLFAAYPALPADRSPEAFGEAAQLGAVAGTTEPPRAAELDALASAKLLVEGLKRAGRELDRDALIDALEAMRAFETGLTPPLTYGPNRRIGALGAQVVAVEPSGDGFTARGWIALP